jgi:hypothetical protein
MAVVPVPPMPHFPYVVRLVVIQQVFLGPVMYHAKSVPEGQSTRAYTLSGVLLEHVYQAPYFFAP